MIVLSVYQGRTADAIFQIRNGLDEARAVGEVVISNRLRRLRAQVRRLLFMFLQRQIVLLSHHALARPHDIWLR